MCLTCVYTPKSMLQHGISFLMLLVCSCFAFFFSLFFNFKPYGHLPRVHLHERRFTTAIVDRERERDMSACLSLWPSSIGERLLVRQDQAKIQTKSIYLVELFTFHDDFILPFLPSSRWLLLFRSLRSFLWVFRFLKFFFSVKSS